MTSPAAQHNPPEPIRQQPPSPVNAMTDQQPQRFTPDNWQWVQDVAQPQMVACLLELRDRVQAIEAFDHHPLFALAESRAQSKKVADLGDRVQALELALRAQAGLLAESEQADLGVVPVSALRGAVRHAVDLAISDARKRLGDSSSTPEPTASIVNINDDVSVRLTDYGRSIIPHVELMYMKTDTDGWTRIQIYHLMRIFGPNIWSQKNVFERNEIKIHS